MSESIHLCLISNQPLPNLIPLLVEKPDQAILLVSDQMKNQATWLEDQLQPRGIKVKQITINPYQFGQVIKKCDELLELYAGQIVLNVTGGTKITALAAFQSFYFHPGNPRIIYLDTANDSFLQLAPEEKSIPMPTDVVQVKEYLGAHGKEIIKSEKPQTDTVRKKGLHRLCRFMVENEKLQGRFNGLVKQNSKGHYATFSLDSFADKQDELIAILEECQVASQTTSGLINIPSKEKLFFCAGGWLEDYVCEAVRDLGIKGIKPLKNVEISWGGDTGKNTTNEFDVLFCYRNRLHIISCKTANLDQQTEFSTKGKEALYELDSLADQTGGLFGKTMLCSIRSLKPHTLKRAENLKIKAINNDQLLNLTTILKSWIL